MRRAALIISVSTLLLAMTAAGAVVAGFPDVPDNHVHADGIAWAAENDLMRRYNNGNFGPEDPVTRGQLATIFHRYDNTLDDFGQRRWWNPGTSWASRSSPEHPEHPATTPK